MGTGDEHKDPASAEAMARMPVFEKRPFSPRTLGNRPQGRWVPVLFGAEKEPEKKVLGGSCESRKDPDLGFEKGQWEQWTLMTLRGMRLETSNKNLLLLA